MNNLPRNSRFARFAATLLLASLAIRALVPVGYMPGNLNAGTLAELCPVASAATFELLGSADTHHHHYNTDDANAFSITTACPIGSSIFFDALPVLADIPDVQLIRHVRTEQHRFLSEPTYRPRKQHARAPPLS